MSEVSAEEIKTPEWVKFVLSHIQGKQALGRKV